MAARPTVCKVIGDGRIRAGGSNAPLSFEEAEPTLSVEEAMEEARRCAAANPCHYCDVCQLMCPDLAITRDPESKEILVDMDYCKGCGLCAYYCPRGAIKMVVDE